MIAVRALFAEFHPSESRRDNPVVLDLDGGRVKITQFFIGLATVIIGLIGLLSAPTEEYDGIGVVVVVLVSLTTLPVSLRWFLGGWPSSKLLVAYVIYADVSIGACLLLKQDLLTAIGGTVLFAVVTTFAVIAVRPLVYWVHMAATVAVLVIVSVRAALNEAASMWVVAAHALTMLLMFAAPMVLVIYVSELRSRAQQSLVDPLTGLCNRRGLFAAVDIVLLDAHKDRSVEMSAVVLDVDGMKHLNDTFGHHTGDAVLVDLAQHLRTVTADKWVVARLGGDEFACVCVAEPGTTEPGVEALVAALSDTRMLSGLSVSVGSATTETHSEGSEQAVLGLLRTADGAMYRAKSARKQIDHRGSAPG